MATPLPALTRRTFLAACATAAATRGAPAAPAPPAPRIVCLDYGLATTTMALGVTPIGVAAAAAWSTWVVEPPLPEGVVDLGTDREINLELLSALQPDLILVTPYVQSLRSRLEEIAPVLNLTIYARNGDPLVRAYEATRVLGERIGRSARAEAFLRSADAYFAACAKRIARADPGPVLLLNFMDARHARVYGAHSLYQTVLDRIGMRNAWTGPASYWGFDMTGLEQIAPAAQPGTTILVFEPVPADVEPTLAASPLWTRLPPIVAGDYAVLPGALMFGTVPAAMRFARLVTDHFDPAGR